MRTAGVGQEVRGQRADPGAGSKIEDREGGGLTTRTTRLTTERAWKEGHTLGDREADQEAEKTTLDTEQAEKTTGRSLTEGYTLGDREADKGTEKTAEKTRARGLTLGDPEVNPDKSTMSAETARQLAQGIVHAVAIGMGEANT